MRKKDSASTREAKKKRAGLIRDNVFIWIENTRCYIDNMDVMENLGAETLVFDMVKGVPFIIGYRHDKKKACRILP